MTFNLKWKPLARMTETVVVFVCCLLSGMMCSAVQVSVAPIPYGEAVSEDYTLSVNGLAVPVYSCRVSAVPLNQIWPGYQRPLDQTELAGFACWEMDGAVQVTVDSKSTVESVVI
ncbi:MAG: hypothetical protein IKW74_02005, partial [Thermoguttaceae bacterium]|nr:hypothetical protein [Thermoguttaceae bacterium]